MKRVIPCMLTVCLLLSGCSGWLDGAYHDEKPHEVQTSQDGEAVVSVSNFASLCRTLSDMVQSGSESGIISVARYDQELVERDMDAAVAQIMTADPIAAYAVESIGYELGTNAGQSAVAVTVTYLHGRTEIQKIQRPEDLEQAKSAIAQALDACDSGIVLYVTGFENTDFAQWTEDYTAANPDKVMELPEVTVNLYPEEGEERVVELKFLYQNSRDSLRDMQKKVSDLFDAAAVYAGGDGDTQEQFFKIYSFLMGLFQSYRLETSITPAYSLLQHGVGDSRAFATVYAAMCGKVGLECIVITGNKSDSGDPWYWNMVCCDGVYYHVDLLACSGSGELSFKLDEDMGGYVWNYSEHASGAAAEAEAE